MNLEFAFGNAKWMRLEKRLCRIGHTHTQGIGGRHLSTFSLNSLVAILEQRAGFDFDIANGAKFLYQGAEWVKGADGLREVYLEKCSRSLNTLIGSVRACCQPDRKRTGT